MWDHDKKAHRSIGDQHLRPESLMMSYGYEPAWSEGSVKPPIFQTSTFVFDSAEEGKAFFELAYGLRDREPGESMGLIYSRLNNPGLEILEDRLTLWDDAEEAASFESGMAAISTTMMAFLRPGDVVAFAEPVYGGTEYLVREILPQFGIRPVGFPAAKGVEGLDAALEEHGVAPRTDPTSETSPEAGRLRMIYIETPSNPTNDLIDIEACARTAEAWGCDDDPVLLAVDNTFLGPLYQHPLKLGADLVLYSLTKYVGGHSDLIAGACLGSSELMQQVKLHRTIFGTMAGPWTSWLLMRSLETLKVRMETQVRNAGIIADFLRDHERVTHVRYLGHLTPDDPQHAIYERQCAAPGGMISFHIDGGEKEAFRFLNALGLVKLAVSLGGTESLAEHPGSMTHSDVPPEAQLEMGITPSLVRISVGLEHPDDIIADLERALAAV